jgi:hypothetical protein
MKEEFGKWLFDIAKYVMTGVILTALFGSVTDQITLISTALCIVMVSLAIGAALLKTNDSKQNKKPIKRKTK